MEPVFGQLLATLLAMWWPFVRLLAMLSFMPVVGENMVPITVRVLLALALAVVLLPVAQPPVPITPFSLLGIVTTIEQVVIGLNIGLCFQLIMAVFTLLGFMASSQMGLSMAVMNDPMSGVT
ncbi:flagellar biosynthetic protein FliR, partial [Phenylobacterium sp.]|uniref:flagellar biosynthetic protein FliR n=1 Tax=Phenylobacterium sp. TaxID=1871053 RepID=UPI004036D422